MKGLENILKALSIDTKKMSHLKVKILMIYNNRNFSVYGVTETILRKHAPDYAGLSGAARGIFRRGGAGQRSETAMSALANGILGSVRTGRIVGYRRQVTVKRIL